MSLWAFLAQHSRRWSVW